MSGRDPRHELARHRLTRAHEALADGDFLLARGSLSGAVCRLYYAAFYAARALLATAGLDSRRHSGVIGLFQQHFVKTGAVPADIAKVLPRSFERRQDSDYTDYTTLDPDDVAALRDAVGRFLDSCSQALERL